MGQELTPADEGALLRALFAGRSKAQFARDTEFPGGPSMISQHLSGHRPINLEAALVYSRGLGVDVEAFSPRIAEQIARISSVDEETGLRSFSLGGRPAFGARVSEVTAPAPLPNEPAIHVPLLANAGSMGSGMDALHEDVMLGSIALSEAWVSKRIQPTQASALKFIHAYGDSMSPTFEDGDVLLVDTGVRDPHDIDGVYVLSVHNRLFIKRVRTRMDNVTEVSSDNPTVKTVDVLNGDVALDVLGRVVWCWNGKKL